MSGPVKLRASAAVGRTVPFSDAPTEQFTAALQEILPPWRIEGTLDDHAHNRRGDAADVTTAVSDVTGKPPRDFAQFCRHYADRFPRPLTRRPRSGWQSASGPPASGLSKW